MEYVRHFLHLCCTNQGFRLKYTAKILFNRDNTTLRGNWDLIVQRNLVITNHRWRSIQRRSKTAGLSSSKPCVTLPKCWTAGVIRELPAHPVSGRALYLQSLKPFLLPCEVPFRPNHASMSVFAMIMRNYEEHEHTLQAHFLGCLFSIFCWWVNLFSSWQEENDITSLR